MSGAISLLPPYVFMACMRIALPFYFLPPKTNMYRSICVETKRHKKLHSAVTKLCTMAGWAASCRSQNTNCLGLTKSNEDRNKEPYSSTLSGALSKLSLLQVVINQNETDKRKCRNFKIFCHNFLKLSTPSIFAGSHSFYSR
jgi:hypothetical protein